MQISIAAAAAAAAVAIDGKTTHGLSWYYSVD